MAPPSVPAPNREREGEREREREREREGIVGGDGGRDKGQSIKGKEEIPEREGEIDRLI